MVWKSNLDENEQEFIEDFGAKVGEPVGVPQPAVPKRPTTSKKNVTSRLFTNKKSESPTKSEPATRLEQYQQPAADLDDGIGGSGEELAQTLEKVVS